MRGQPSDDYPFDAYVNKRAVARRHRTTQFGFTITVIALVLVVITAFVRALLHVPYLFLWAAWLLLVSAHGYTIVQAFLLKYALGENTFFSILFAACMATPIVNLLALVSVNFEAIALLRRAGVRVGFLGVSAKNYDRRFSPWLCNWCDYDLTGNRSGVCPECGNKIPASMLGILAERDAMLIGKTEI